MITIRYYLHSKESAKGTRSIYMDVHAGGLVRLRQAIGEAVTAAQWNRKKERVTAKHEYADILNARLDRLELKVQLHFREMLDEGEVPTGPDLRALLRPLREQKKQQTGPPPVRTLYEAWKLEYLQRKNRGADIASLLDTPLEKKLQGYNYARIYKQVVAALEEFKPDATSKDLSAKNWEPYLEHLHSMGVEDTTIATHVKGWKVLRQQAGLPTGDSWLKNTFNKAKLLPDLTWKEIKQLADHTYSTSQLQEVAHAFVMDCQLALRWSDMSTLGPQHLHPIDTPAFGTVSCVRKRMGKTGGVAFVPFPPLAQGLWDQYQRIPLPVGKRTGKANLQVYNKLLKKAAQEAKLTRLVTVEEFKGGRHIETRQPLHEVITSHTARHTAASRIREAADFETAQLVLGHATSGNTGRYAHLEPTKTAERILAAWAYYK